ncbi:MAG TPA: RNA polymerase sigma-70 factor [Puia sp.]|nr:RNA polymerase sigma-70 factor [Puia sp.]
MKKDDSFSDSVLLGIQQRAAAGDEEAFKKIYYLFYKKLYLFSLALVKTREAAEEITEDVFIKIWQQKARIATIHNLRVYLYIATKNTSLNYLSKKAKDNLTQPFDNINIDLFKSASTPEELMITAEMYRKIQQQVEALPLRCKMIFKLIREDGLKYKEVSDILNISVNTIDVQMAIAVKKIAAALKPEFDALISGKNKPAGLHKLHGSTQRP